MTPEEYILSLGLDRFSTVESGVSLHLGYFDRSVLGELLSELPHELELCFFRYYENQSYIADHTGLYCNIQRHCQEFAMRGGNHGRTTGWGKIAMSEAMAVITPNLLNPDSFLQIRNVIRRVEEWYDSPF